MFCRPAQNLSLCEVLFIAGSALGGELLSGSVTMQRRRGETLSFFPWPGGSPVRAGETALADASATAAWPDAPAHMEAAKALNF